MICVEYSLIAVPGQNECITYPQVYNVGHCRLSRRSLQAFTTVYVGLPFKIAIDAKNCLLTLNLHKMSLGTMHLGE